MRTYWTAERTSQCSESESESEKQIQGIKPDRLPQELQIEVCDICIGSRDQDHPQEKEMQKGKMIV